MKKMAFLLGVMVCVILAGCGDSDAPQKVEEAEGGSFLVNLVISRDEGASSLSAVAQCSGSGLGGEVRSLPEGYLLSIDNIPLLIDSAALSGLYYEPVEDLPYKSGPYKLSLKRDGKEVLETEFNLESFSMSQTIEPAEQSKGLSIPVTGGSEALRSLRVSIVDTAFRTDDVHELVDASEGQIRLEPSYLRGLRAGPQVLQLSAEEVFVKEGKKGETIRVTIRQGLLREFLLR